MMFFCIHKLYVDNSPSFVSRSFLDGVSQSIPIEISCMTTPQRIKIYVGQKIVCQEMRLTDKRLGDPSSPGHPCGGEVKQFRAILVANDCMCSTPSRRALGDNLVTIKCRT